MDHLDQPLEAVEHFHLNHLNVNLIFGGMFFYIGEKYLQVEFIPMQEWTIQMTGLPVIYSYQVGLLSL